MINLDNIVDDNNKKHNEKWPYIQDHLYIILIIGGSGSGKTNTMLNLINEQRDRQNLFVCKRFKYEHLISNRENAGINYLSDSKAFIDCSNTMSDVYENKTFQSIIKELFFRCRKINIYLVFIT